MRLYGKDISSYYGTAPWKLSESVNYRKTQSLNNDQKPHLLLQCQQRELRKMMREGHLDAPVHAQLYAELQMHSLFIHF